MHLAHHTETMRGEQAVLLHASALQRYVSDRSDLGSSQQGLTVLHAGLRGCVGGAAARGCGQCGAGDPAGCRVRLTGASLHHEIGPHLTYDCWAASVAASGHNMCNIRTTWFDCQEQHISAIATLADVSPVVALPASTSCHLQHLLYHLASCGASGRRAAAAQAGGCCS